MPDSTPTPGSDAVRAVFFDAVGTLIHPQPAAGAVYAEVGRAHGSRYPAEQITARFHEAFRLEEQLDAGTDWRTSADREYRRWQAIVAAVLDDIRDPEACFRELYHHFAQPAAWRLDGAMIALLNRLSRLDLKLGVASNFDHRLREVIAGFPELHSLQHIVISAEVGWRKPAPEFFAAVSRAADVPPAQILFVGDDPENDFVGANAAGMQAFLLRGGDDVAVLAELLDTSS